MFFGPHVGITDTGKVGMVVRPGQLQPTSCCGAAMAGLKKLIAGGITYKPSCDYSVDDYQQETLEQLLLKNEKEIIGSDPSDEAGQFVRMTEVVFREAKATMERLMVGVHFESPAFAFGGILINEDGGRESSIALRSVLQGEADKVTDVTDLFTKQSVDMLKAMEKQ